MVVAREYLKALIDRLSEEQAQALLVILNSMAWREENLTPDEAREADEGVKELNAGLGVRAENVWEMLDI